TDLWDSTLPIKCIAEHFPGRTTNAVRKHGRYGLGLPDRNGEAWSGHIDRLGRDSARAAEGADG
ncbi:hypothetical protein, partial [Pandoraea sp. PE-S2R-1]|uniref:hypothetical protein n=1 Tax=Pandoraea sp. PE-S2R-1 TaxID=1986994 RepID=UPI001BAFCD4A